MLIDFFEILWEVAKITCNFAIGSAKTILNDLLTEAVKS